MAHIRNNIVQKSLVETYKKAPLWFVKGQGSWLECEDGGRYLDLGAGIAVNCLGHSNPLLNEALRKQSELLWHTSNLYNLPVQEKLANKLTENTFADRIFFTNSGTESIECAIKMVRKYQSDKGFTNKNVILTVEGSFHGRSIAAISASASPKLTRGFEPTLPGFRNIRFCELQDIEASIDEKTCAILIEPIQGEGGIREVPIEVLQRLRKISLENDILLILDEIQCGVGRTGKFFAFEYADIRPDVVAVAKGLGGGFPLGCCLVTEEVASCFTPGTHGSTFGGNPLACAVGTAVVKEIFSNGFLSDVKIKGNRLKLFLEKLVDENRDVLASVRGKGLMLGLKCAIESSILIDLAYKNFLLLVPAAENVVRILPPLNITDSDLEEGMARLKDVVLKLKSLK